MLTNLSLASGGTYKCEVSAEAPSFRTKFAKQDMVVVVLPTKGEIVGVQPKYQVGDIVNVTCFSYRSRPSASLTWRVNGLEVSQFLLFPICVVNCNKFLSHVLFPASISVSKKFQGSFSAGIVVHSGEQ